MGGKIYNRLRTARIIPAEFIISELERAGIVGKRTKTSVMIVCPFHGDTDPSLSISLGGRVPEGVFHCLGCGISGVWNDLANRIGIRTWDVNSVGDRLYINRSKKKISSSFEEEHTPLILSPWEGKWKTYGSSWLNRFGAKKLWDPKCKDYYLYMPITYLGEQQGYIRAKVHPESVGPKYWFPLGLVKSLYPIDILIHSSTKTLVLVEGLGDVLRLLKYGIPTAGLLGVTLTKVMYEQLDILDVDTIILCMDGDEAGRRAVLGYISEDGSRVRGLAEILSKTRDVRVLFPPPPSLEEDDIKAHDPDSMPYEYVCVLKHLVISTGGSLLDSI